MSIILDVKSDLSNLGEILEKYDAILAKAGDDLMITDKSLQDANTEQPIHLAYYMSKLVELKSIRQRVQIKVDQTRGSRWQHYKETPSIALGTKDIDQYINGEDKIASLTMMVAIVNEIVGQFETLVEAFKSRGFALRNITEARIAEVHNYVL